MALYLHDRLIELGHRDVLPAVVLDRLQQNQIDNTARTRGMIAESVSLQHEFPACRAYLRRDEGSIALP